MFYSCDGKAEFSLLQLQCHMIRDHSNMTICCLSTFIIVFNVKNKIKIPLMNIIFKRTCFKHMFNIEYI